MPHCDVRQRLLRAGSESKKMFLPGLKPRSEGIRCLERNGFDIPVHDQ